MAGPRKTEDSRAAFLAAYGELGNIKQAAKKAGISRDTHYAWLKDDPDYAKTFELAREEAVETLEAEARRRAVEGVNRPVYQGGEQVGTVRDYSDTLLIFLLKGAAPSKYRDTARVQVEPTEGFAEMLRLADERAQAKDADPS